MRKALITTAVAVVICIFTINVLYGGKEEAELNTKKAAESVNAFGLDLYGKIKNQGGNLFLSPSSISSALGMAYAGAKGKTAEEMKKVLHFDLADEQLHPAMGKLSELLTHKEAGSKVSIANALWGQDGLEWLDSFLALTNKCYGAGLNLVDFKNATEDARQEINKWVEEKTNNKIKDLIQPGVLDVETKLVLTNAIHFKGTWKNQFKTRRTRKVKFHLDKNRGIEAELMHMYDEKFKYMKGADFQGLELLYAGDKLSMVIFLPNKMDGLAKLEKECTVENLDKWISQMKSAKIDRLGIPKFKMICEFSLSDTLAELGMPTAFTENADFSGMRAKNDILISAVVHKAFVDVNEEGTEAAAATGVIMKAKEEARQQTIFYADHPFLFLIRDVKTGAILFMGRLANPEL